jgi:hypothetical protein
VDHADLDYKLGLEQKSNFIFAAQLPSQNLHHYWVLMLDLVQR